MLTEWQISEAVTLSSIVTALAFFLAQSDEPNTLPQKIVRISASCDQLATLFDQASEDRGTIVPPTYELFQ